MRVFFIFLFFFATAGSHLALAQSISQKNDNVIWISAPKPSQNLSNTEATTSKLYFNDPAPLSPQRLDAELEALSGVHITRQGGSGKSTSIFLRGANPNHTLVIIDGVTLNDPSSPNRSYDFGSLNLDEIESVKVYKGPQNIIYGSDALSGVIEIKTKKAQKKNKTNYTLSAGPFNYQKAKASQTYRKNKWSGLFSASAESTDGISAANIPNQTNERDGHKLYTFNGSLQYDLSEVTLIRFFARGSEQLTELDYGEFSLQDDPNSDSKEKHLLTSLHSETYFSPQLKSSIQVGHSIHQRVDTNLPDLLSSKEIHSNYNGRDLNFKWIWTYEKSNTFMLMPGLQAQSEWARFNRNDDGRVTSLGTKSSVNKGVFINSLWSRSPFKLESGLRVKQHNSSELNSNYSVRPLYILDKHNTLYARLSTGSKNPSLYQLYDQTYGNSNLEREEVFGRELGFKTMALPVEFGIQFFQNNYKNLINTKPLNGQHTYFNVDSSRIQGVEAEASYTKKGLFKTGVNSSYIDARNEDTRKTLLRRPYIRSNAYLNIQLNDYHQVRVQNKFVGSRNDYDSETFVIKKMPSYSIWSVGSLHKLQQNLSLSMRVENLLDKKYEEIDGYGTYPFSLYVALKGEL